MNSIIMFTNLGINTIDGSVISIRNILSCLDNLQLHTHLLLLQKPVGQFLSFLNTLKNVKHYHIIKITNVKKRINEFITLYNCHHIIVRSWGPEDVWFADSYANKVCFYAPLLTQYSDLQLKIFRQCRIICQTPSILANIKKYVPEVRHFILTPMVRLESFVTKNTNPIVISYIGTIRKECESMHILKTLYKIATGDENVLINVIVGKNMDHSEQTFMNKLAKHKRILLKYQETHEQCLEYMKNSNAMIAFWESNEQNNNQVSTKFLEGLANFCFVIGNRHNSFNRELVGNSNVRYLINEINEFESVLSKLIEDIRNDNLVINRNFTLRMYSLEKNSHRLARELNIPFAPNIISLAKYFDLSFDTIYAVYSNNTEKCAFETTFNTLGIKYRLIPKTVGIYITIFEECILNGSQKILILTDNPKNGKANDFANTSETISDVCDSPSGNAFASTGETMDAVLPVKRSSSIATSLSPQDVNWLSRFLELEISDFRILYLGSDDKLTAIAFDRSIFAEMKELISTGVVLEEKDLHSYAQFLETKYSDQTYAYPIF